MEDPEALEARVSMLPAAARSHSALRSPSEQVPGQDRGAPTCYHSWRLCKVTPPPQRPLAPRPCYHPDTVRGKLKATVGRWDTKPYF